ncbi:hypothetical protein ACC861_38165, partial [Rhizobium ruizarguesonis]
DRRGMATCMAIMGFGGGAMIGAPLANLLINAFKTDSSVGVWQTFIVMPVAMPSRSGNHLISVETGEM